MSAKTNALAVERAGAKIIDDIIEELGASVKIVSIRVGKSTLQFKIDCDSQALSRIQTGAETVAERLSRPCPGEMADLTPCDRRTAALAFLVSEMSHEPKLTLSDALRFARKPGHAFDRVVALIDSLTTTDVEITEIKAVESSKKGSSAMSDLGTG